MAADKGEVFIFQNKPASGCSVISFSRATARVAPTAIIGGTINYGNASAFYIYKPSNFRIFRKIIPTLMGLDYF